METEFLRQSYTAADAVPVKLFHHDAVRALRPVHVQWIPTNRCNLHCKVCSCAKRNRSLEMDADAAADVIGNLARLGCRAVTITGGGEPLMHPRLDAMVEAFFDNSIDVGLVTNGALLDRAPTTLLSRLTWCRISHTDDRAFGDQYRQELSETVWRAPVADWAFSYVAGNDANLDTIESLVDFANEHDFTHVRIVGDLLAPNEVDFEAIRRRLDGKDGRVIYQPRKTPVPCRECLIGYVKPMIGPDFTMYHCCGVQYALAEPSLDLPEELSMGSALRLDAIYGGEQPPYRTRCVRCYYTRYNDVLRSMAQTPDHVNFI